jgi:2'-deoxynucleoside 5'-phosphate N-hydrolase
MPTAYLAIKYHPDSSNRAHIESILRELEKLGYTTACVARDLEQWGKTHLSAEDLMQKSFELLDASDTVVVDLTEKSVGLGIEAGYAYAKGKPILTIARSGSDISTTLSGISSRIAWYNEYEEISLLLVKR